MALVVAGGGRLKHWVKATRMMSDESKRQGLGEEQEEW